jgi:hypothetical protein
MRGGEGETREREEREREERERESNRTEADLSKQGCKFNLSPTALTELTPVALGGGGGGGGGARGAGA